MASPLTQTVVIECPHCGTRYQLPPEAIGPRGRQVACAHCGQTWQAKGVEAPPPADADVLFDEAAERELDAAFAAAEAAAGAMPAPAAEADPDDAGRMRTIAEIKAAIAPRPRPAASAADAAGQKKRDRAFNQRQAALSRRLPLAKLRRVARIGGVSMLLALIAIGVAFRTDIVRLLPDLAGAYQALGLGVNVVGLEFRDVTTLVSLRNGNRVMQVDARIYSVAAHAARVPPVVVTLLDDAETSLYEWSVTPAARELEPGEVVDFTTQLSSPPDGATRVRLTFGDGNSRAETAIPQSATKSN